MTRSYIKHGFIGDEKDVSLDSALPASTHWNATISASLRVRVCVAVCACQLCMSVRVRNRRSSCQDL